MTHELVGAASIARARAHELRARAAAVLQAASEAVAEAQRHVDDQTKTDTSRLEREVEGLRTALESRAVIEQAKGIVMGAMNCDATRAFDVLVRQSQHENRKLQDIARALVASKSLPRG